LSLFKAVKFICFVIVYFSLPVVWSLVDTDILKRRRKDITKKIKTSAGSPFSKDIDIGSDLLGVI